MYVPSISLNSEKNALFKNVKFDSSSHLKENQMGLVSQKQMTVCTKLEKIRLNRI
jgi:hypothetical protein